MAGRNEKALSVDSAPPQREGAGFQTRERSCHSLASLAQRRHSPGEASAVSAASMASDTRTEAHALVASSPKQGKQVSACQVEEPSRELVRRTCVAPASFALAGLSGVCLYGGLAGSSHPGQSCLAGVLNRINTSEPIVFRRLAGANHQPARTWCMRWGLAILHPYIH